MCRWRILTVIPVVLALLVWAEPSRAGVIFRMASNEGGDDGGPSINIIVREVKVTPIRAHIGDVITVEMVTEDREDLVHNNINAYIYANGKVVAKKLISFGYGGDGGRIQRHTFRWDTRGNQPGEYRIRGEAFVWSDASPFDNSLDVPQPLVLLPAGTAFPEGEKGGGSAVGRDPRYTPARSQGGEANPSAGTGSF